MRGSGNSHDELPKSLRIMPRLIELVANHCWKHFKITNMV